MRIGLGFIHGRFSIHTSESTKFRALAREWRKLGHEVYLVHAEDRLARVNSYIEKHKSFNEDLLPFVVAYNDERLRNLDVICESFDYHCMHKYVGFLDTGDTNYYSKARLKSGVLVWALPPLPERFTREVLDYRYPLFVSGRKSYEEVTDMGVDANLYLDGVDLSVFNYKDAPKADKVRFMWVGGRGMASAPDLLLKSYFNEFTSKDDVSLTIICTDGGFRNFFDEVSPKRNDLPEVNIIEGKQSPEMMADHYRTHDALVMPIRFHATCRPESPYLFPTLSI